MSRPAAVAMFLLLFAYNEKQIELRRGVFYFGNESFFISLRDPANQVAVKKRAAMAVANIDEYLKLLPTVKRSPSNLWSSYDPEADTLYINFKKPSQANESDITDDDVIVRYENGEIVGLTILHASKR